MKRCPAFYNKVGRLMSSGMPPKTAVAVVKDAIKHLKHDIKEQQDGIKRDKQTIKKLNRLI